MHFLKHPKYQYEIYTLPAEAFSVKEGITRKAQHYPVRTDNSSLTSMEQNTTALRSLRFLFAPLCVKSLYARLRIQFNNHQKKSTCNPNKSTEIFKKYQQHSLSSLIKQKKSTPDQHQIYKSASIYKTNK